MTSKISYSKFIKEDIRHRGWLAVLSAVLLLLCVTVSAMLLLEASLTNITDTGLEEQLRIFRNIFPALLNGSYSLPLTALLLLLGVLCAVTGFSYLHSRERTDFYHSLPLSKRQLFFISYLSGLLIFFVPYLAACLLTILAGSGYGFMTISVLGRCVISMLGGILAFLLVYHLTILAMVLTGKTVTGILATGAMFFYGSIIGVLAAELPQYFFSTYCTGRQGLLDKIYDFLSPWPIFGNLLGSSGYFQTENEVFSYFTYFLRRLVRPSDTHSLPIILAAAAVYLAVLLLAALLLYQKRPSESAENALAFSGTAPFIKVLISVPTALCIGILVGSMYYSSTKWIILISILSVLLLCAVIEFIYHMDVRRLFAGKYSALLSFLGVAGILCILEFDLFGYDTRLPEEDSLESMNLDISDMHGYFCYPDSMYINTGRSLIQDLDGEKNQIRDFAPIYELAAEGVENARSDISSRVNQGTEDSVRYVTATVRYNRKSGKPIYRCYMVSADRALDTLTALCREESYRKQLFPIFYVDYHEVSEIRLTDIYQDPKVLDLTEKEQDALLDAYKKDVLNIDIRNLQYESPIGELYLNMPETSQPAGSQLYDSRQDITVPGFYLYEDYENSLELLEEYGYTIRRELDPEDVEEIRLTESYYAENAAADQSFFVPETSERIVTDSDEIAEILSQIQYVTDRILVSAPVSGQSAGILLKGSKDTVYYTMKP